MLRVLSTHLFLNQRLHPGLLELAARSGAQAVEIFAARQHFDYASREHIAELAVLVPLQSAAAILHARAPSSPIARWAAPALPPSTFCTLRKSRRIDAMDEIKRALEAAELIPFTNLIVHLGERDDGWSQRTIEYAIPPSSTSAPLPVPSACACWLKT